MHKPAAKQATPSPLPVMGRGRGGVNHQPPASLANRSQDDYFQPMRLALKTGSYSLMHLTVAIAVTYAITQDWRASLAVGLIEPAVQTVAFLLHDRVWAKIEAKRPVA